MKEATLDFESQSQSQSQTHNSDFQSHKNDNPRKSRVFSDGIF